MAAVASMRATTSSLTDMRRCAAEIIDRLNQEANAALVDPKIKARMAESGGSALAGSPADFGKLIADETEKWAKVIRAASIKAE